MKMGWGVGYKTGYEPIFIKISILVPLKLAMLKDHSAIFNLLQVSTFVKHGK